MDFAITVFLDGIWTFIGNDGEPSTEAAFWHVSFPLTQICEDGGKVFFKKESFIFQLLQN